MTKNGHWFLIDIPERPEFPIIVICGVVLLRMSLGVWSIIVLPIDYSSSSNLDLVIHYGGSSKTVDFGHPSLVKAYYHIKCSPLNHTIIVIDLK